MIDSAVTRYAASLSAETRVCVAFSGGMDSAVLLHALVHALAAKHKNLTAHHVHHGLSPNADAWAAHCQSVCDALNVPLTIERVHVPRSSKIGIEAAAREARYASFLKINAAHIVLAHHARDQAETVLLQLLRGAGPAGLAAMSSAAAQSERLHRPLLNIPFAALKAYAQTHSLTWIEDESNLSEKFSRNRLRHKVWPSILQAFPSAETTLARAAGLQAEAAGLLNDLAAIDAAHCIDTHGALKLNAFKNHPPPRQANLLRHWLRSHALPTPAQDTLQEWRAQLTDVGNDQHLALNADHGKRWIRVYRGLAYVVDDAPPWLAVPWLGETHISFGSHTIHFTKAPLGLRLPKENEHWMIRPRAAGDKIRLSENSGHVPLKNILQNANVPPWLRERIPVLLCNDEIAAVVGIVTANEYVTTNGLAHHCPPRNQPPAAINP